MFQELVKRARSIRRFDASRPVTRDELAALVDLGRLVPSGGNQQPLRYRLVCGAECGTLFPHLAWAAALPDWPGPAPAERPTGYIVMLSDAGKEAPATDLGIAGYALQLAAADRGLGACMFGSIRREELHAALGLPAAWAIRLVVAFGYPAETVVLEELASGASVNYYRTADGVHHVPKRRLADVLIDS